MKTPKRDYFAYAEQDMYTTPGTANKLSTRWKRKNRIKQLKRSLCKYKYGTMLDDQFDLYLAYKWLQRLKKPSNDADSKSWEYYRHKLGAIRGVIVCALMDSGEELKKALERENRKEKA